MSQFISKTLYLTKGHHRSLVLMMLLFLLISSLEVVGTGMVGPFIAVATNANVVRENYWLHLVYQSLNFSSIQQFTVFFGALVLIAFYIKTCLSFIAQKSVFEFGYTLKGDLASRLFRSYLAAPYSFHLKTNSATLIQNIIATTDNVCLYTVMPLLTAISNTAIALALILLLIKTSALALISLAILLPIAIGLSEILKSRLAFWNQEGWGAATEMIRIINHGLGSLKETRTLGCEPYFEGQMQQQTQRYAKNLTLNQAYNNLPRFVMEALMISFIVIFTFLYLNLNRGREQDLTAILGIFALASIRLLPALSNLTACLNTARANMFAIDKLFFDLQEIETYKLLMPTSSVVDITESTKIELKKNIYIDKINFTYPGAARKSLTEISIAIAKGQSIGLIGKSGAGKTTLVDVLLGLFVPQSGDIKVDGISIYSNLRAWQNTIGYVPQSIFLIDDTLERNIAFGVPEEAIDRHRLRKAVEMAQLGEVVAQLPEGLKTVVGERGILLSGGQRQRVGIARVLYHERQVLVFDEATAALDTETEHLVTEATKALSGSKTIIIIAHRLSTIEHCDCIYQLDRGEIIRSGTYKDFVVER